MSLSTRDAVLLVVLAAVSAGLMGMAVAVEVMDRIGTAAAPADGAQPGAAETWVRRGSDANDLSTADRVLTRRTMWICRNDVHLADASPQGDTAK